MTSYCGLLPRELYAYSMAVMNASALASGSKVLLPWEYMALVPTSNSSVEGMMLSSKRRLSLSPCKITSEVKRGLGLIKKLASLPRFKNLYQASLYYVGSLPVLGFLINMGKSGGICTNMDSGRVSLSRSKIIA